MSEVDSVLQSRRRPGPHVSRLAVTDCPEPDTAKFHRPTVTKAEMPEASYLPYSNPALYTAVNVSGLQCQERAVLETTLNTLNSLSNAHR